MTNITPLDSNLPALFADPLPRSTLLDSGLARAIEPDKVVRFDDDPVSSGARVAEAPFKLPERVPASWMDGARSYLRDFGAKDKPACSVSGGLRVVRQWMLELIGGYPHGMDSATLHMRATALVEVVEDFPLWCFTKASRKRAAVRFGFVPSTKEVADFVAAIDAEVRQPAHRVKRVVDAGPREPENPDAEPWHQRADFKWQYPGQWEDMRRASNEKRERENRELRAIIEARDAAKRAAE